MCIRPALLTIVLAPSLLLLAPPPPLAAAERNLVDNPSFDRSGDGAIPGWHTEITGSFVLPKGAGGDLIASLAKAWSKELIQARGRGGLPVLGPRRLRLSGRAKSVQKTLKDLLVENLR